MRHVAALMNLAAAAFGILTVAVAITQLDHGMPKYMMCAAGTYIATTNLLRSAIR